MKSKKYDKIIAFCLTRFFDEENSRIINQVLAEGRKRNWKVQIISTLADLFYGDAADLGSKTIVEKMDPSKYDGIIILGETFKSDSEIRNMIERASKADVPVISIDKYYPECINIRFDYKRSFESVVKHMIEDHGYKDTVLISGVPGNLYTYERENAYKKVLAENGIPFKEENIIYGGFWEEPTINEMKKFFAEGRKLPEAFICANDNMAFTMLAILEDHGIKVPEDVAVSGYDGITITEYSSPKLTTVQSDYKALFETAFNMIQNDKCMMPKGSTTEIISPFKCGQSCGCKMDEPVKHNNPALVKMKRKYHNEINFNETLNRLINEDGTKTPSYESLESLRTYMNKMSFSKMYLCVEESIVEEAITGIPRDENALKSDYMYSFLFKKDDIERIKKVRINHKEQFIPNMDDMLESDDSCLILPFHLGEDGVGYTVLLFDENEIVYTAFGSYLAYLQMLLNMQRKQAISDYYKKQLEELRSK